MGPWPKWGGEVATAKLRPRNLPCQSATGTTEDEDVGARHFVPLHDGVFS